METNTKEYDLLHDSIARSMERQWLVDIEAKAWKKDENKRALVPGVSVIIPAHKSEKTIGATLESLTSQSFPKASYEIIVACNGEPDGSATIIENHAKNNPELNLRIIHLPVGNAGRARNHGIALARREYITFVDADDQVEPLFLESAFKHASSQQLVVSPIIDRDVDGTLNSANSLNKRISELAGTSVELSTVPWLLGFNACKLVPTKLIADITYSEELSSGEDLVFFAHLLRNPAVKATFPHNIHDSAYIRNLHANSISRQPESFDFNVKQRVACIRKLTEIEVPESQLNARRSLENAQLNFVRRYLERHPSDTDQLENHLSEIGFVDFPWSRINMGKARDLAILYCAAPFSDTSAVVAEKVIASRGHLVDVISNNLEGVRRTDKSTLFLSSRWVDERKTISAPPSFAGWGPISEYAVQALSTAEKMAEQKGGYRTVYSRALWVGAHVASALFKNRNPSVHWTAEFSDPLRFGVDGAPRVGAIDDNSVARTLQTMVSSRGYDTKNVSSLFDLVELVTFLVADELIFTNENQMKYMLAPYPQKVQLEVRSKAVVRPHPSPSKAAYKAVKSDFILDPGRISVGYFGSFYSNRGFEDVFSAIINLSPSIRRSFKLYIFCNTVEEAATDIARWGVGDAVSVFPYLPYMEFLNASTKFDVLLVNDVLSGGQLPFNPFLPSKVSDYLGSGSKLWGLVDPGSPLSQLNLDFVSEVGNSASIVRSLVKITGDFSN